MKVKSWIACIAILLLVGCGSEISLDTLYEHNRIESTSFEDVKDEEFIVYYYSETCKYCQQFAPTILEYVNNGRHPLYMFDIYGQGKPISDDLRQFLVGEGVEAVPTLVQYKREKDVLEKVWVNIGVIEFELIP